MQGARVLRTEAYEQYAAGTKGEAQRRRWARFSGLLRAQIDPEAGPFSAAMIRARTGNTSSSASVRSVA